MEYIQKTPDFPPNRTALNNQCDNPSAQIDLTDTVATNCTLVRQTGITAFASAHGTAFRINPTAASSLFTLGGDYGGMRNGMVAGGTYTISAIFYVDVSLTGTPSAQNRQIAVGCISPTNNGGGAFYLALSNQGANVGGTATRVSVTFTIPRDATSIVVRFFNGYPTGSCYWTDILIAPGTGIEADGVTTVPFFDGSTAASLSYNYAWTGTAGKSTSSRTINTVPGPFADFINIIDPTDAANYVAAANDAAGFTQYQVAPHCQA